MFEAGLAAIVFNVSKMTRRLSFEAAVVAKRFCVADRSFPHAGIKQSMPLGGFRVSKDT